MKYWDGKLIILKGLDLDYMTHIDVDQDIEDFHPHVLEGEALVQVFKFCECLGYQMTQDTFMKHKTLYKHGCKCLICILVCTQFL